MLRKLGIFERALLFSDNKAPFNVIGVVQLEEPPSPDTLEQALEFLQKRHPFLQARIAQTGRDPFFENMPDLEMPLEISQRINNEQWVKIVEREMGRRIDSTNGPLFRIIYIHERSKAELILTFHHAIMDAASGMNLVDEILSLCAALQAGEAVGLPVLALIPPVEQRFPPAFKGLRCIPSMLAYMFSQMGEEMGYRWKVRGKRTARVHPGGNGHILTLIIPEDLLESISRRTRKEKVTLNSLLSASMLLAVNRHLYDGVSQPMQTITFANLRSYTTPPTSSEDMANYISMLRYNLEVSGDRNIWDITRDLHGRIYSSFKHGSKFIASMMSESMVKMFVGLNSLRMCASGLNYSGAIPLHTKFGNIKVTGLHGFNSAYRVGPELAAQARLFNDQLWMDFVYMDSDMDGSLAEKIVAEIQIILAQAVSAPDSTIY